jgi:hypothetical protein
MNLEFTNGVAQFLLSKPREMEVIRLAAAELVNRTYHMGSKPTPGRGYNDRLTAPTGLSATTCYEYLRLDP